MSGANFIFIIVFDLQGAIVGMEYFVIFYGMCFARVYKIGRSGNLLRKLILGSRGPMAEMMLMSSPSPSPLYIQLKNSKKRSLPVFAS